MDAFGLDSFLSDIKGRDDFLKTANVPNNENMPPVRGGPAVEDITPAEKPKKAKAPKKATAPVAPPAPKDDAAIWDAEEVPSLEAARPTSAPASAAGGGAVPAKDMKPRQRKHAYEYFNQWDRYDVDGELDKLEEKKRAEAAEAAEAEASKQKNDGLPPDMTATMLAQMPPVEIERRALNEKDKGNEAYKAGEYRTAVVHYTHSLRLQANNHVVYANRGMCYLKLKQYRQALGDSTAAIQIDDAYTKAYLRRGIAHRRLNQHAQALKDLDIVMHREPHNKEAAEHRRCSQIEREKELRAEREFAESKANATGKKSSVVIEEIDGDSDEEAAAPAEPEQMRRFRAEEEAKDARERARAAEAEKRGRERSGPFVDPQAMQESDDLMSNLQSMSTSSFAGMPGKQQPQESKSAKKKVAIVEEDGEADAPAVAVDGFEPSAKFAGARAGWVFKKGPNGLGYYREEQPAPAGGMRRMAIVEDDESEEEEDVPIKVVPKSSDSGGMRKMAIVEDDDESEEEAEAPLGPQAEAALAKADATRVQGNEAFKESQYEAAAEKYSAALSQLLDRSHSSEAALAVKCLNNRAACSCQLQQYRAAIADCSEVLALSPRDAKALMRRGFAYESIERYAEALADMRMVQSVEPSPQASAACIRLSKFAAQREKLDGKTPTAVDDKPKAAPPKAAPPKAAPPPAKPSPAASETAPAPAPEGESKVMAEYKATQAKERGTAALRGGEFRQAAEAYHEACKLQPSVHTHFSNLALALLKFGQPEHAATAARRCTELEPSFGKGFFRLGQALKAKADYAGGADAFRQALKLHQQAHPNGGKEAGKEAAEIARELAACRDKAKEEAEAKPASVPAAAGKAKGITPVETAPAAAATEATTSDKGASAGSPPKRSVDHAAAAATAKRAAELATKASAGGGAATLSSFERQLTAVWAKGKGAAQPEALREVLAQLPTSAGGMSAFVRESLTEELLTGIIAASKAAGEPAKVPAERLAHLAACKRFDMAWMFAGKAEKTAVQELLAAGQGEMPAADLTTALQRYGVKV